MHKRIGNAMHQVQAVTLVVIHKLAEGFKVDYFASKVNEEEESIVD